MTSLADIWRGGAAKTAHRAFRRLHRRRDDQRRAGGVEGDASSKIDGNMAFWHGKKQQQKSERHGAAPAAASVRLYSGSAAFSLKSAVWHSLPQRSPHHRWRIGWYLAATPPPALHLWRMGSAARSGLNGAMAWRAGAVALSWRSVCGIGAPSSSHIRRIRREMAYNVGIALSRCVASRKRRGFRAALSASPHSCVPVISGAAAPLARTVHAIACANSIISGRGVKQADAVALVDNGATACAPRISSAWWYRRISLAGRQFAGVSKAPRVFALRLLWCAHSDVNNDNRRAESA